MTRRPLAVAALTLLVVAPLAAAGPWTQPRGDASATGFQPEGGPDHPDVALRVEMEGSFRAEADAPPLILEDRILFLAREAYDAADDTYQVYSLDRASGNVSVVGELGRANALRIATDGDTVYAAGPHAIHAFPLTTEGHDWTWRWETPLGEGSSYGCTQLAADRGTVTALCYESHNLGAGLQPTASGPGAGAGTGGTGSRALVPRLDAETGAADWVWRQPDPGNLTRPGAPATLAQPYGLAVAADRVVVQTIEGNAVIAGGGAGTPAGAAGAAAFAGRGNLTVRALEAEDGTPAWDEPWSRPVTVTVLDTPEASRGPSGDVEREPRLTIGNPAASASTVYTKADGVRALNLGTGEEIWSRSVGEEDATPGLGGGTALALGPDQVLTTTSQTVYGFDADNPDESWQKSLDLTADKGFDEAPVVTHDALYVGAVASDGPDAIHAFGAEDGDPRWHHPLENNLFSFAVGDGVLAYTDVEFGEETANTTIVVLGETEASPDPTASVSTTYPDRGEPVRVDLSDSGAGLQGPVTRYKANWGDGNTTGWQANPVLTHTYNESGDKKARFVVGNDANQTASTTETFHVGEDPPREPNLAEKAFAPENQEMTFGIIGIAMALGGGAIGVARRHHKRSRLQQELDALEQGFRETRDDPGECEAFLDTRKGRARSLALDGKLNEEQAGIVASRAEELRRELRRGAVEEEFGFLPHELVRKARKMLEDGEVTELEAEAFLAALEEVDFLREEQEALVRERIEDWYGRDAGGGAG